GLVEERGRGSARGLGRLVKRRSQAALHAGGAPRRDDALRRGAIERADGGLHRVGGGAGGRLHGRGGLLQVGAQLALGGAVARRPLHALAVTLLGGCVVGHVVYSLLRRGSGVGGLRVVALGVDRELRRPVRPLLALAALPGGARLVL